MVSATMSPTSSKISDEAAHSFKKKWDQLRGREHDLSRERASLLFEVWNRLQRVDSLLQQFLVSVLGEYPGKRCQAFVRLARAYDEIRENETWVMIGGHGVVLLSRMNGHSRRVVLRKTRETLNRTGRETVTIGTFRAIIRETLGKAGYRAILTEPQQRTALRQELITLKDFILPLIRRFPDIEKRMTAEVRRVLGVDLLDKKG